MAIVAIKTGYVDISGSSNGQVLVSGGSGINAYWGNPGGRILSNTTIVSPLTWNSNNYDIYATTALAANLTINADSGNPSDGKKVIFRIKDNGSTKTLTWTAGVSNGFRAIGTTLPTTTTASKTTYVGCIYNAADSRWDVVAVTTEV
jgi:hypothetical protein